MRAEVLNRGFEYRGTFDSLAELVEHVSTAKNVNGQTSSTSTEDPGTGRPYADNARKPWHGTRTWDEAVGLAANGWTGADERIKTLGAAIADRVASLIERPRWSRDVSGDALDVGLYLAGEPECWRTLEWEIAEGYGRRIFRVIVPTGAFQTVKPDSYTWAGAAACAAVQAIEMAGHGAEVWAYNAADSWSGHRIAARVLLKAAEYPLDLPRLAFVAANAAFHRRLLFSFRESSPLEFSRHFGNYGRTSYDYLTTREIEPNDFILPTPAAVDEYRNAGGPQEGLMLWLRDALSKAGVLRADAA